MRNDAFGEHFHGQLAGCEPAQRRRHPQPLVIAATRVEADDEIDVAEARLQRVEVRRQVVASAFLACFDQSDAARVRHALRREGTERR